ncbi:ABC transporter A family member 2-like isoform X1 [Rhododendron vialii]|uniref:ABC transporter A family member 2-like isoform X1 n=1 Tax=Rhododendron vialii TaxID=182163 RepID=UPI00265F41C9|nr:ABC transporter A family member 2-like isoform X1 [Rhododendron vialii]
MDLQSGLPLLVQQFKALFLKNLILTWRSKGFTLAQLLSPLVFMSLLYVVEKSANPSEGKPLYDPVALIAQPIPPCEEKFYTTLPCYDFIWSGNKSAKIASIVGQIMANNPGRSIPPSKVKSFQTKKEVDDWLFNNPMRCPGALHFEERNATVISYGIQTNSTQVGKRKQFEDATFKFQIPLQVAAEREIARSFIGDPKFSWVVALKEFAHPAIVTQSLIKMVVKFSSAPLFLVALAMFSSVFQIRSLVTEKELKLRQAMTIMCLYDTAYWLSWLTWESTFSLLLSLVTVLCGRMFRFPLFLRNSFLIVFLTFFLFQISMIGFAFMLSTILRKASSSITMGFFIFILSFVTQAISTSGFPYGEEFAIKFKIIWSLFPPNLLSKALGILSGAADKKDGINWSKRSMCFDRSSSDSLAKSCIVTMNNIFAMYIATFFLWFVVAIYLDNIIPNSSGVRKPIFYFLNPGYWTGKGGNKIEEGGIFSFLSAIPQVQPKTPDDEDVLEEENFVKHQIREDLVDPNVVVQIRGLTKTYPGKIEIGCCKCTRKSHFHAVKGLWVNIPKGQLFCLLGPNGAGKTTTISCLTGISPATGGDALVYGHSIRSSVGMSSIRKLIGVCPQFDVLWDVLSAEEHLYLFASIKGIAAASIKLAVEKSLAEVKLTYAAKGRASGYSGGMKRRLSVAIALIGDPKLVILDEPTTGMDPITRRHVWDIIDNAKKGRAIILTTHSMEEADILSDRIGIVAKGTLRCIGNSIRLKSKFGSGLIANVSFSETNTDAAESCRLALRKFFKHHLNVMPKEETKYFVGYVIPHKEESDLKKFFTELQERETEFGISDIQLNLTTLEDVFLNVATKAALENAADENNMTTLVLESGKSLIIPVGVEKIGIPGSVTPQYLSGLMVEVYWGQDSNGNLCITGHSAEMPIPVRDDLGSSLPPSLLKGNPDHGIVLDF